MTEPDYAEPLSPQKRAHEERDPLTNTCVYCYRNEKPNPDARIIVDLIPRTATTTGGV